MSSSTRRWIVILCLAAILLAALTPAVSGVLAAILIPLFLFCITVVIRVAYATVPRRPRPFPFLRVLASRPPPAR